MRVEPYYELKCHTGYKILPKDILAITLFGHIFFRMSDEEFDEYLETHEGKATMHHEYIHVLQGRSFRTWIGFYIVYLYYYFKNLIVEKMDSFDAYLDIPFEKEAFENEYDFDYMKTEWKKYID